ncbi:FtsK/SpoIIIE domain-containing protein [Streptomyces sp. 5-10]|uniref:FtsK/SpoIIIE domain-containing protein n=1 Tax=Streptomyces sp. 5-10 TaxID=878925 RepID=UPI0019B96744|nr:FtsK/SpoIIIE domain-containing protein [Streptomyces sp. 5-10]MBD3004668.1 hypothetical protein [Streptomyces sp. 5-10]
MRIGMDAATNDAVTIPINSRILIAGASSYGKSWTLRPLLATALLRGHCLMLLDGKGEEAHAWSSVCRTAVTEDQVASAIDDLWSEMKERRQFMSRHGMLRWNGPLAVTAVDEGAEILSVVQADKGYLDRLVTLVAFGRSRGMPWWWATSNPRVGGSRPGLNPAMVPSMDHRFALHLRSSCHSLMLDTDSEVSPLDMAQTARGHGYLADYAPNPVAVDSVDDMTVYGLKKFV